MKYLFLALVLCFVWNPVWPQTHVNVNPGLVTGNIYRGLTQELKIMYVTGLLDGMYATPMFSTINNKEEWLVDCMEGINTLQVMAIFDNYLEDNPLTWRRGMNRTAYTALWDSCKK